MTAGRGSSLFGDEQLDLEGAVDLGLLQDAQAASRPSTPGLEPIELIIRPAHSYVDPKKATGKKGRGCRHVHDGGRVCMQARFAFCHNVPTLNELGIRSGWQTMDDALKRWREGLTVHLQESGLQRGLDSVLVEGVMTFPTRARRDQGNHRYFVEKALGDALVKGNAGCRENMDEAEIIPGGWLPDDSWAQYEFGNMQARYLKGIRSLSLRLMPNALAPLG